MTLLYYEFGTYKIGSTVYLDGYWLNPDKIVGVRAKAMDRSSSMIMLEGGIEITVNKAPDEVACIIRYTMELPSK